LKGKPFGHTQALDFQILQEVSMDRRLNMIFNLVGWGNFWNIIENGSKLLTIEFLCTLHVTALGVAFRLFKQTFTLTWRELSNLIGLDAALEDYNRH
jgi:hypothetical protein